jgi:hypothetical protein
MAYVTRTHVDPGDPGTSSDQNQGMDNEEYLKARTDYFAVQLQVVEALANCGVGDGQAYLTVPQRIGGMDLKRVHAKVITNGTTSTMLIQVRNVTQAADMLSTRISIDSAEPGSDTAAAPAVIDTANDDVAAFDLLAIDIDQVHTTPAKGLLVTLEFG